MAGSIEPDYRLEVERCVRELGAADWVQLTGQQSNEQLMRWMHESTLTVAFYERDCVNNRLCSPNKFFDALHADTLLVCSDSPLGRSTVQAEGWGQVCDAESLSAVVYALEQGLQQARQRQDASNQPSSFERLRQRYSWQEESKKIVQSLQQHVAGGVVNESVLKR